MRISISKMKLAAVDPNILDGLVAVFQNSAKAVLSSVNPTAITDSSTGTPGSATALVPTFETYTYPGTGALLASRADFNTAVTAANDGIASLADSLNDLLTALGLPTITLNDGGVTANTLEAQTKTVTGVDGSGSTTLLRTQANSALSVARNNLATLLRSYNLCAQALGVATIQDNTGGKADLESPALVNLVTATTAADASADAVSKAAADTALTVLANNLSHVATKMTNPLYHANTKVAIPVVVVP